MGIDQEAKELAWEPSGVMGRFCWRSIGPLPKPALEARISTTFGATDDGGPGKAKQESLPILQPRLLMFHVFMVGSFLLPDALLIYSKIGQVGPGTAKFDRFRLNPAD